MIRTRLLTVAAALAACGLALSPAHALSNRAWLSGKGTDAPGCGAPTAPCRTFQYVHDNIIAAGGEIDVLDPAGYGAVTINKALSIVNDGVGTAGVQAASGNAITINAGASDTVTLRGLNIDGLGTGLNGIVFNSGGGLTIVNCVVRHFGDNGILIQPTSGTMVFLVSNVTASDNALAGVSFLPASGTPSATGEIDHVIATSNQIGISVASINTSGGVMALALSYDVASENSQYGVLVSGGGGQLTVSIDNSSMNGNGGTGLSAGATANVLLGRSVITSNSLFGVVNNTSPNRLYTYGDNRINGSGTSDIVGSLNTTFTPR